MTYRKNDPRLMGENNPAKRPEVRAKISRNRALVGNKSGPEASHWKGGISIVEDTAEYIVFRKKMYERDNYTCQICFVRGGIELNLDHIKPKAIYPELVMEPFNVRTLCRPCHLKTDTWGGGTVRMKKQLQNI